MKRTRDGVHNVQDDDIERSRILAQLQTLVSPLFYTSIKGKPTCDLLQLIMSIRFPPRAHAGEGGSE